MTIYTEKSHTQMTQQQCSTTSWRRLSLWSQWRQFKKNGYSNITWAITVGSGLWQLLWGYLLLIYCLLLP
ncbi:hypothetical protein [Nostoc sp. MS1]|uniref:hypothetical protein n=1 Tax=Nostoc sp. MS1 TaxID=2764711 RepID=UPI001CC4DE4A|nr:hypothetical protein [Nostoc sp. MS1]